MFSFFKKDRKEKSVTKEYQTDYHNVVSILNYFHAQTGVTFENKESILKNKVTSFCRMRDIHSFDDLLKDIKVQQSLKQELIDHLTTNETYFYREIKQINQLVQIIKKEDRCVEILCAPSSTGEEAYTIAIALLEAGIASSSFRILGIDINAQATQRAVEGKYKERNLRNLSSSVMEKYFTKENDRYYLDKSVKALVRFEVHNIFDATFKSLGRFDFIFSRNMLIYFDKETKLKAKGILESMRKNRQYEVFFGHADLF